MSLQVGPPPGYYPDPQGSGQQRWWDGRQWTGHLAAPAYSPFAPMAPAAARSARSSPGLIVVLVAVVVLALVAAMVGYRALRHPRSAAPSGVVSAASSSNAQPPTTPEPSPGSPVVTPNQAYLVLDQFWGKHERALVTKDLATLKRLETGAAAAYEPGAVSCGCMAITYPRPLQQTKVFVPRQVAYPAHFLVEAQTESGGAPWAEVLVFTKAAAGRPWLVSEDSGFGPPAGQQPSLGVPTTDDHGYVLPPTRQQHALAVHLAAQLAAAWQVTKEAGRVDDTGRFSLVGQPGYRFEQIAAHRQDAVQADGLLGHFTFSVSQDDPLVEFDDGGFDLACQAVREKVVYSDASGALIRQDQARSAWGPDLAPGSYRTVTSRDAWQTCFLVNPNVAMPVVVFDQDTGGSVATAG